MSTQLEVEALETLRTVIAWFSYRVISTTDYTRVMGQIRDMVKKLEANESGCATGKHLSYCTCKPPVQGVCQKKQID